MGETIRLSVLDGSVEITGEDGAVEQVERPVEARLAAALALRQGRAVEGDLLIEAVWGDSPPNNPSAALQTSISRLRRLLGPSGEKRLLRRGNGYRLSDVQSDAADFLDLVRRRDDEPDDARLSRLKTALDIAPVTGVLGGLRATEWLESEARVLDQMRLRAAEEYFALAIRLGRQSEIMVDIAELAERNPDRESLWGLWMLALYRNGSRAEALGVYQTIRDRLADELGLQPSSTLTTIEEAILTGDEELLRRLGYDTLGAARPAPIPNRVGGFFGRTSELNELDRRIDVEQLICVVGLRGVGKSRLVAEVCANRQEADTGAIWWSVISAESDTPIPVQLLTDAGVSHDTGDPMEGLVAAIPYDPVVVVLDGTNDRTDEAAEVARSIARSRPLATVLLTTAAFPELSDFSIIELGPLETSGPENAGFAPADLMLKDRLHRHSRAFTIEDRKVAELANRVGGWPLALDILAGHLVTPAGRHRLESGGLMSLPFTASDRYEAAVSLGDVLEEVVQWLPDETQTAFMVTSAFEGAFTVEFALDVLSPWYDSNRALDLLEQLHRHSLLRVDASSVWSGYRMADAVRIFARDRAEAAGVLDAARESILRVFAEIGSRTEAITHSTWTDRRSTASAHEHDLAAAIEYAARSSDPRLANVVALRSIGLANSGRTTQAVNATDIVMTADLAPSLELMICHVARAAYLCDIHENTLAGPVFGAPLAGWFQVRPRDDWLRQSEESLRTAEDIGAELDLDGTDALLAFARTAQRMAVGDPEGAIEGFGDSLAQLESLERFATLSVWRYRLGEAHFAAGHDREAEQVFKAVASTAEDVGLRLLHGAALSGLARIAMARQDWSSASESLSEVESIVDEARMPLAVVLNRLRQMYVGIFSGDRELMSRSRNLVSGILNQVGSMRLHSLFSIFDMVETASESGWDIEPAQLRDRSISIARGNPFKAAEIQILVLQVAERDGNESFAGLYEGAVDATLDPDSRRRALDEITGLGGYGTYLLCARAAHLCGDEEFANELGRLAGKIRDRYRMTPSPSPFSRDLEPGQKPGVAELWEEVDRAIPKLRRILLVG